MLKYIIFNKDITDDDNFVVWSKDKKYHIFHETSKLYYLDQDKEKGQICAIDKSLENIDFTVGDTVVLF